MFCKTTDRWTCSFYEDIAGNGILFANRAQVNKGTSTQHESQKYFQHSISISVFYSSKNKSSGLETMNYSIPDIFVFKKPDLPHQTEDYISRIVSIGHPKNSKKKNKKIILPFFSVMNLNVYRHKLYKCVLAKTGALELEFGKTIYQFSENQRHNVFLCE